MSNGGSNGTNGSSSFERHFETPLMDIETECVTIPEMEYQVEMSLSSTIFATIIHQLRGFGNNLEIRCNETVNRWTATTQESGSMSVDMKIDDLNEFAIEEACDLSLEFALQYLANVGSYSKICKNVHLKMHADFPLRLDYPLDTDTDANIKFYLAPKIREDE
jgi:proliferating cell nuclear antigen PCNA